MAPAIEPLGFMAGIISRKSNSSGRRLTADGCFGESSGRREKRLRNLDTADGAADEPGDSVEKEGFVGEATALDVAVAVTDIIEGMPSWLILGDGEADKESLPRSVLERDTRSMSRAFACGSVSEAVEKVEGIDSAEVPRLESHASSEKGALPTPNRDDCSHDSEVRMSLVSGLF